MKRWTVSTLQSSLHWADISSVLCPRQDFQNISLLLVCFIVLLCWVLLKKAIEIIFPLDCCAEMGINPGWLTGPWAPLRMRLVSEWPEVLLKGTGENGRKVRKRIIDVAGTQMPAPVNISELCSAFTLSQTEDGTDLKSYSGFAGTFRVMMWACVDLAFKSPALFFYIIHAGTAAA